MKRSYVLHFSNSNNVWYDVDSFYGTEIDMLKYCHKKLNDKENKLYNLWIYDMHKNILYADWTLSGRFQRGKKLEKLINSKQKEYGN